MRFKKIKMVFKMIEGSHYTSCGMAAQPVPDDAERVWRHHRDGNRLPLHKRRTGIKGKNVCLNQTHRFISQKLHM
jgi:hypothetical protein